MIITWMSYAALCAALIGVAAACVDAVLALMRRARRGVWIAAMLTSILVPLALPFVPRAVNAPVADQSPAVAASDVPASVPASSETSARIDTIVLSAWAAASLLFALSLLIAHRRTTVALAHCRPATVGGRSALISNDFGPAVVGVLRPHIVVPAWTLALDEAEQQLVVAHEHEHARTGDPLLALAGVIAVVLMPWNVALWWQLARLRLAIELDCDARVITGRRGDALAYSRLLVSVGERGRAMRHPVLAMSRSRSALAKRFDALLRRDAFRPRRIAALAALGLGAVSSVAFIPAPHLSDLIDAMRAPQPAGAVTTTPRTSAEPIQTATFTPATPDARSNASTQNARRTTPQRVRRAPASLDVNALPPVRVVRETSRSPLDSVVVARATLPPNTIRPVGGVIMAVPGGSAPRGGFVSRSAPAVGADSNQIIRGGRGGGGGGRGGRAVLVPRPDSTRPPA